MNIDSSMDQYEKQLYSLFSSYGTAHNGNLSREALQDLCNSLQLGDRGKQLLTLLCKDDIECGITFQNFRNGLLMVLGDENYNGAVHQTDPNENISEGDSSGREVSPKFVFGSKKYGRRSRPSYKTDQTDIASDNTLITERGSCDPSSLESLSKTNTPKIRRSLSLNDGRYTERGDGNLGDSSSCVTHLSVTKVENIECTSQTVYNTLDCNSNTNKLLHSSLSFDGSVEQRIQSLVSDSMETIANQEMDQLTGSNSMEELIPSNNIVELWESIGIAHPQQLLQELGFQNRNVKVSQVICVLEEEIKMMASNIQESLASHSLYILFQAALCLYRCESKSLKLCLSHTAAERNKLKTDLCDANQRTVMLAHEVDENHANMENIMKQSVRQLEIKHAEMIKQITEEFNSEKELSSMSVNKLEKKLFLLETEDVKLKTHISNLQDENFKLEKEFNKVQEELFELRDIKSRLSKELKVLGDEQRKKLDSVKSSDDGDVSELEHKLTRYIEENIALKDKNDELCAELDSLKTMLSSNATRNLEISEDDPVHNVHIDESDVSSASSAESKLDECDHAAVPLTPVDVHTTFSQAKEGLELSSLKTEEQVKGHKFVICLNSGAAECSRALLDIIKGQVTQSDDDFIENIRHYILLILVIIKKLATHIGCFLQNGEQSYENTSLSIVLNQILEAILNFKYDNEEQNIGSIVSENSTLSHNNEHDLAKLTDELFNLKTKIAELNNCLLKERSEREGEKQKDVEKYQELEANMELLRNEYFKCEEYWSTKLNEEREIFDQEQRITDEKFTELLTKLSEYEEQYTSQDKKNSRFDGPLSTIEEKCHLEKQFNDLEDEFQEYRTKAENESRAKDLEINDLKEKITKLEESLKNAVNTEKNQENIQVAASCNPEPPHQQNGLNCSQPFANKTENSEKEINYIHSPINYLWNQKTISSPIANLKNTSESQRDYHNPAYRFKDNNSDSGMNGSPCITPIQKPASSKLSTPDARLESVALKSPHETKMLNCSDLEETLQGRSKKQLQQNDHQAKFSSDSQKPIIQNQNNSAILKTVALEIHCRQLQTALRQQQIYAENVFQQTVAAHRAEMGALKQRLAAADLLVRDLYVENCHLARNINNNPILK